MSLRVLLTALALTVFTGVAPAAELVAGRDYSELEVRQRTDAPGKVEVLEFFSYACPHCYELQPQIKAWSAKLPADVVFKRVPAGFGRPDWAALSKAFYTLDAMGQLQKLDDGIFDAIHRDRIPLNNDAAISRWVATKGVDAAAYAAAFKSFSVSTQYSQADRLAATYRIDAVPALIVGGRYRVLGANQAQMLANTNALIAKVRAETAPAAR